MNKKVVVRISFLVIIALECSATVSYIAVRSQSNNTARALFERRIVSGEYATRLYEIGLTGMYQQSWNMQHINRCLFGSDLICERTILIQGSHFNNGERNEHAWLADYFGLPTDFTGAISYHPIVKNGSIELGGWFVCKNGFFVDFQIPLVHTISRLNACETHSDTGDLGYINGYFSENAIDPSDLLSTARQFFEAELAPNLGDDIIFNPLQVSKFMFKGTHCQKDHKTRVSDIIVRIGYDALVRQNGACKIYARFSVPAGNKPKGIFLLEPIVGNGGHWALGAGTSAELCLWDSDCGQHSFYIFADAYAQHLFKTKQKRSFDLVAKPNSRYILAQRLGTIRKDPSLSGASDAGLEFQNEYTPVANLTYGTVNVSANVEGEIMARLVGFCNAWQCALGYTFWGRSSEKIWYATTPSELHNGTWALKGDAHVIGFRSTDNAAVRLAAVQNADIHQGTNNFPTGIDGLDPIQNPGIINRVTATTGAGIDVLAVPFLPETTNTSNPASVITSCDVDMSGRSGISNTLFGSFAYAPIDDCCSVAPLVELGGQVEFGSSCQRCALSTWGIWLTLGLGF